MKKYRQEKSKLDIYPEIHNGNCVTISIIGNPKGLKTLAKLLVDLADLDQEASDDPEGTREHVHIHPNSVLGNNSCEVEICRADAKGTGAFPEFMS